MSAKHTPCEICGAEAPAHRGACQRVGVDAICLPPNQHGLPLHYGYGADLEADLLEARSLLATSEALKCFHEDRENEAEIENDHLRTELEAEQSINEDLSATLAGMLARFAASDDGLSDAEIACAVRARAAIAKARGA